MKASITEGCRCRACGNSFTQDQFVVSEDNKVFRCPNWKCANIIIDIRAGGIVVDNLISTAIAFWEINDTSSLTLDPPTIPAPPQPL